MDMKVAIVGSRSAGDEMYEKMVPHIPAGCSEVVSGGAQGADALAERFAKENDLAFTCFLPEYQKHGNIAPLIRNDKIVDYSDYVLILWDMKSKGSRYVIKSCLKNEKPFKIIEITKTDTKSLA